MTEFLLDTNVISEFARSDNKPDQRVKAWLEAVVPQSLYISVLTLGEIRRGIEKLQPGSRRTLLEAWLEKDLREWFENRLLIIDASIANRGGVLAASAHRKGKPLAVIDGLLSATALERNLTVVTRNSADFMQTGVPLLNPWQA